MTTTKIRIDRIGNTTEIEAEIYGQVAVHKTWRTSGVVERGEWTLSHVLSGYAIEYSFSKRVAVKLAKDLQVLGFDFDLFYKNGGGEKQPLLSEARALVRNTPKTR